ncbi:hypothetical protein X744_31885 [Mesorhizobium sp. LNJC372A00]|nr:hypothetical protein X745_31240 [Mesorhizobium sp. LNJC374B00]ESY50731.1 hypothetical protein X744_31885 [Mesorhizobium sp. LNJC372A00]
MDLGSCALICLDHSVAAQGPPGRLSGKVTLKKVLKMVNVTLRNGETLSEQAEIPTGAPAAPLLGRRRWKPSS